MTRNYFPMVLVALLLAVPPVTVNAREELLFCESSCEELSVSNQSGSVVTKVKVMQLAGPDQCEEVTKTHQKNMDLGQSVSVHAFKNCPYKVRFYTTAGCAGDKSGTMQPEDIENGKKWIFLKGACGGLKVVLRGPEE